MAIPGVIEQPLKLAAAADVDYQAMQRDAGITDFLELFMEEGYMGQESFQEVDFRQPWHIRIQRIQNPHGSVLRHVWVLETFPHAPDILCIWTWPGPCVECTPGRLSPRRMTATKLIHNHRQPFPPCAAAIVHVLIINHDDVHGIEGKAC